MGSTLFLIRIGENVETTGFSQMPLLIYTVDVVQFIHHSILDL